MLNYLLLRDLRGTRKASLCKVGFFVPDLGKFFTLVKIALNKFSLVYHTLNLRELNWFDGLRHEVH